VVDSVLEWSYQTIYTTPSPPPLFSLSALPAPHRGEEVAACGGGLGGLLAAFPALALPAFPAARTTAVTLQRLDLLRWLEFKTIRNNSKQFETIRPHRRRVLLLPELVRRGEADRLTAAQHLQQQKKRIVTR
jgi:hypothetical protein